MLNCCKTGLKMRYLLSDLYIAFNPATELRSPSWFHDGRGGETELTKEELIIHGCFIRQRLQQQLPDLHYRILKLHFKQPGDLPSAMADINAIRPVVIEEARIYSVDDNRFVDLCCLNECWRTDLFRTRQYGPMKRYAPFSRPELLSRRRRRISASLQVMKVEAVSMANNVLASSCDMERLVG